MLRLPGNSSHGLSVLRPVPNDRLSSFCCLFSHFHSANCLGKQQYLRKQWLTLCENVNGWFFESLFVISSCVTYDFSYPMCFSFSLSQQNFLRVRYLVIIIHDTLCFFFFCFPIKIQSPYCITMTTLMHIRESGAFA